MPSNKNPDSSEPKPDPKPVATTPHQEPPKPVMNPAAALIVQTNSQDPPSEYKVGRANDGKKS
jgi:hypothetical protein